MSESYSQTIMITDNGPFVTSLTLAMPGPVKADQLESRYFHVREALYDYQGRAFKRPKSFFAPGEMILCQADRIVTDLYPSDRKGKRLEEGQFVTLDLAYGPIYPASGALTFEWGTVNTHEYFADCRFTVTLKESLNENCPQGLVFDHCTQVYKPQLAVWNESVSSYRPQPLRYMYYVPQMPSRTKRPLVVWLHGAGEGGQETEITISGNKVVALAEEPIQRKLGGAYILAPQCPTMWMDDGSGRYGLSGRSIYVQALMACINEFVQNNSYGIDTDRIYLGGDSNGGFMTMRMIIDYPDTFAAAFPMCEALYDNTITDADIEKIKNIPIWFTHSKDDPVVKPADTVIPTYQRLKDAGAANVHFTFWNGIYDLHGTFKNADGSPYRYVGHFAWVPVLNDDDRLDLDGKPVMAEGREVTLWDWMGLQNKA